VRVPTVGHNDGIDLAVPRGTPVQAAENGVVAYAGSELKGYGNLVLIRHANNWVSAYAHNDEIVVKRGEKVTRGQVIAKAGATGAVSQPLVHFELRKGSRPVDPTKYMTDQTANAD
jgi:murein DD-endopeptidase MepM/ murein hydrolase activator NlpD